MNNDSMSLNYSFESYYVQITTIILNILELYFSVENDKSVLQNM